jgi:hypothetical protein
MAVYMYTKNVQASDEEAPVPDIEYALAVDDDDLTVSENVSESVEASTAVTLTVSDPNNGVTVTKDDSSTATVDVVDNNNGTWTITPSTTGNVVIKIAASGYKTETVTIPVTKKVLNIALKVDDDEVTSAEIGDTVSIVVTDADGDVSDATITVNGDALSGTTNYEATKEDVANGLTIVVSKDGYETANATLSVTKKTRKITTTNVNVSNGAATIEIDGSNADSTDVAELVKASFTSVSVEREDDFAGDAAALTIERVEKADTTITITLTGNLTTDDVVTVNFAETASYANGSFEVTVQ